MSGTISSRGPRPHAAILGLLAGLLAHAGMAGAANPDFDAVAWVPRDCNAVDLVSHTTPAAVDFVGDATFPAVYFAHDDTYLYFRYRMDQNPGTFAQYSWTALMQVPSGDPFQYQYQLSLNGKSDTIEIWQNTVAQDISFDPLFRDDAEVNLFLQKYNLANGSTVNTTPLARSLPTGDGSHFGGDTDYFVDFAFPISVMLAKGLIANAADLDDSVFFPPPRRTPTTTTRGTSSAPSSPWPTFRSG